MYSDLFDQLGAAGGRRGATSAPAAPPAAPPLVSFKAGKMILTPKDGQDENSDSNSGNKTYDCKPDTKRGEVRMVWQDGALKWQWYDRRDKKVLESHKIEPNSNTSFERVTLPALKKHAKDRIYVWTRKDADSGETKHDMYWMQDESDDKEDETVAKVNQYLADPASAAPPSASATLAAATGGGDSGSGASSSGAAGSANPNQSQVDALSSILENLGMPQGGGEGAGVTGSAMASGTGNTGTLTLADLQGAMASMPQATGQRPSVLPLSEVVTPAAISSLLEHEEVCQRLIELLPEEQRTRDRLEENLRSPQIQQTLRSLTQALLPDDAGNMDGFYSVLANFQLDPADGQTALVGASSDGSGPIQAFLDALLASVEKEEGGSTANMETEENKDSSSDGGEEKEQDGASG